MAEHSGQDLITSPEGVFRMDGGVVETGAVHHAGQQGSLWEGEVLGSGAEEVAGRCLNAVGVPVEEHDVEVALQNLVLAVLLLEFDGELHLPQLVPDSFLPAADDLIPPVRGHEGLSDNIGDVLLCQRGCALPAATAQVGRQRPENSLRVHTGVLVKAPVLDGDDGVFDIRGHLVQADFHTVFRVESGDQFPVRGQHFGGLRRRIHRQRRRELVEECDRITAGNAGCSYTGNHQAGDQDAADDADCEVSEESQEGRAETGTGSFAQRLFSRRLPSLR